MTKREMLMAVVAGKVDADVVEMAKAELVKMDEALAKKSAKAKSSKAEADKPVMDEIASFLEDAGTLVLASDVAKVVGVSTQKAMALLKKLVEAGTVEMVEVKVEKVGIRKAFRLV